MIRSNLITKTFGQLSPDLLRRDAGKITVFQDRIDDSTECLRLLGGH